MSKEVVLSIEEFREMLRLIRELKAANKSLNKQVQEYNKYASEHNMRGE